MGRKPDLKKQLTASVAFWQTNPLSWVADNFGPNIKLTQQQSELFRQLGKLVDAKRHRAIGAPMTAEQRELAKKIGISIQAGKGVGKDFTAALIIMWWLDVFEDSRLPCTANNAQQLQNVLWAEIASIMGKALRLEGQAETVLEAKFCWMGQKVYNKDKKETWFAEALAYPQNGSPEQQARTLTGRHSRFLLAVLDEAAGIPDPVYTSGVMETLVGVLNLSLLIFNPTQNKGFAYDSQTIYRDQYLCFQWSQEDCPELIPRDLIEQKEKMYGRDSNTFRVSVLGLPPHAGAGAFLPMEWVTAATQREFEDEDESAPLIAGVDVGGGGDKSVICLRRGGTVLPFLRFSDRNTMKTVDWVAETMLAHGVAVAYVDIVGLGRGVYDRLVQMGYRVRPADARGKPASETYYNNRSQWYMKLRQQFEAGTISIPHGERDLIDQLNAIAYRPEEKNKILGKKEIRKELSGASPDEADALALTFAGLDHIHRNGKSGAGIDWSGVFCR